MSFTRRAERLGPPLVFALALAGLGGLVLGGDPGACLLALAAGALPPALLAMAGRDAPRGVPLSLGALLLGSLALLLALAAHPAPPRLGTWPLATVVFLVGVWLLPLVLVSCSFARGPSRGALEPESPQGADSRRGRKARR